MKDEEYVGVWEHEKELKYAKEEAQHTLESAAQQAKTVMMDRMDAAHEQGAKEAHAAVQAAVAAAEKTWSAKMHELDRVSREDKETLTKAHEKNIVEARLAMQRQFEGTRGEERERASKRQEEAVASAIERVEKEMAAKVNEKAGQFY